MINNKVITGNEPITLIGYSHGGNVDFQSARLLNKMLDIKVNVLTISTPPFNGSSSENPATNIGVNEHSNIVHANDPVPDIATSGGGALFQNPKTLNFVVQPSNKDEYEGVESHTMFPRSKYFPEYLKAIPPFNNANQSIPTQKNMNDYKGLSLKEIKEKVYKAAGL